MSELLAYAASLWTSDRPAVGADNSAIREAYEGGESDYWRPFLLHLAKHADQWVRLSDAFAAVGLTSPEGTGMLGAAERRCGSHVPYNKRWREGKRDFQMDGVTAAIILGLAEEK